MTQPVYDRLWYDFAADVMYALPVDGGTRHGLMCPWVKLSPEQAEVVLLTPAGAQLVLDVAALCAGYKAALRG